MDFPLTSLPLWATLPHPRSSGLSVPPSNVTSGPVVVVVNSTLSAATNVFTVTNPAIGSLLPPAAAPGGTITINGSGFQLDATQTIQVLFNGISFTPNQFSATSIMARVPSSATSGPVTVVVRASAVIALASWWSSSPPSLRFRLQLAHSTAEGPSCPSRLGWRLRRNAKRAVDPTRSEMMGPIRSRVNCYML